MSGLEKSPESERQDLTPLQAAAIETTLTAMVEERDAFEKAGKGPVRELVVGLSEDAKYFVAVSEQTGASRDDQDKFSVRITPLDEMVGRLETGEAPPEAVLLGWDSWPHKVDQMRDGGSIQVTLDTGKINQGETPQRKKSTQLFIPIEFMRGEDWQHPTLSIRDGRNFETVNVRPLSTEDLTPSEHTGN